MEPARRPKRASRADNKKLMRGGEGKERGEPRGEKRERGSEIIND